MRLTAFLWLKIILTMLVLGGQWHHISPHNLHTNYIKRPHPFLCLQKIPLKDATLLDLLATDVLSFNKAFKVYNFLQSNPTASMRDLTNISGIGDKTVIKLEDYIK
jgi:hypothetical protein